MTTQRQRFIALLAGIGVTLLVVTAALYLVVAGRDVEQTIGPLVGFASPLVVSLFGYAGLAEKLDVAATRLDKVHAEVNGNTTQILDKNTELLDKLNAAESELRVLKSQKGGES